VLHLSVTPSFSCRLDEYKVRKGSPVKHPSLCNINSNNANAATHFNLLATL
jgi:hypothetical protein